MELSGSASEVRGWPAAVGVECSAGALNLSISTGPRLTIRCPKRVVDTKSVSNWDVEHKPQQSSDLM